MKLRTLFYAGLLMLFISAAFTPLPKSAEDLFGPDNDAPDWLYTSWVADVHDMDNIEFFHLAKDIGFWTPSHRDESKVVRFDYEFETRRGKGNYALKAKFEDGSKRTLPFKHSTGRFKMQLPNGRTVVWTHRVTFKKAPFPGSSKVFYAHEKRG
jgi:hypothetical protein